MPSAVTHPHARTAVHLANNYQAHRAHVDRELTVTGTPRSLYILARVLRAAQIMDGLNASYPAIVAKAA